MNIHYRIMMLLFNIADKCGFLRLAAKGFRYVATTGIGSDSCLKEGFLPIPVHFYSPIPDIEDLRKRDVWSKVSGMAGIDFQKEAQASLLEEIGVRFGEECSWAYEPDGNTETFFLNNPSFSFGCAASTHGLIRQLQPKKVIEIGSGMSTRVILSALRKNAIESGLLENYQVVDPYPSAEIKKLMGKNLITQRVELLDVEFFAELAEDDILFIDSSHSVKIGSDVNYLFLEVLPRLAPGVVVHVHDISLPYEYAQAYATNSAFRQFWTEQYLLQAFLSCNDKFEVLFGVHFLMTDHQEVFKQAFPYYHPERYSVVSGSFWIRRKQQRSIAA